MDDNLQQKYFQMQMIGTQMKQIEQQLESVGNQIMELQFMKDSLDEIPQSKIDSEILVPVGNGIFAKASLKNNEDVIVSVGAGVAVKKSFKDTAEMIDSQINDMRNVESQLISKLEQYAMIVQDFEHQLKE